MGAITPDAMGLLVMQIAGISICALWVMNITSYKTLNEAKFSVINAIEQKFVEQPFHDEWRKLDPDQDGRRHRPFHKVEGVVPWVFIFVYLIQTARLIPWGRLENLVCVFA